MTDVQVARTTTRMEDHTWTELEDLAPAAPYWVVVTGSVEQHGPHLPLAADTLVVERLADLIAERHGAIVLPAVRVGVLHAFQDWPGMRVPREVFIGQVLAYASTAVRYVNRLLILNGHDENHEPLMSAARELNEHSSTDVVVVEWAELVNDVIRRVSESRSESHAGEGLTSVFKFWYPERVRVDRIALGTVVGGGLTTDDLHVATRGHRPRRFARADVPSGVLGDPRRATAEKGDSITGALVMRIDQIVRERGWL